MILTRGIARSAGRALAVKRANAALFGTLSVTPKPLPILTAANPSCRRSRTATSPSSHGTLSNPPIGPCSIGPFFPMMADDFSAYSSDARDRGKGPKWRHGKD